ncbi:PepSY domain-containing protein [Curvibacter sp. HBC61]|uniref:PepSY domain-containing protein n=1 Tax=Curvibacter cyanobacteriorum TaxID=3026422 RepID=A0ABT5N0C8_9BURK|nr:PepSY domain-containing protein [Curvibacter sp. HBC61]MDD0839776.1 PepSY domain-containing protein [Curvibacter sp. HBC61]
MHSAKRCLFLIHRWLGVVLCAFFAMWFVSGVVMMYVGYPKLTASERLEHLPALERGAAYLSPREALDRAGIAGPLKDLRLLASRAGQPVYLAVPAGGASAAGGGKRRPPPGAGTVVIDALTGTVLREVGPTEALASAAAYAGTQPVPMQYEGTINEDAFTHSRGLDAHRPLHRVQLQDPQHTLLYISGKTGEVVRDAPRAERWWNYVGAWIHWLYPFRGNVFDAWWTDIVNWLSIAGIALTLTGTVVGLWRWRFNGRYKSGSRSPYQGFMMRWHHITGLLFALITLTWIFSGLMSMNPWKVLDSGAPPLRTQAMDDGPLRIAPTAASPAALLAAAGSSVRELRWTRATGQDLVLASRPAGRPAVLDAATATARTLDPAHTVAAASRLVEAPVKRVETLAAYDLYYYQREAHTMSGGGDKPLPVLRLVFDDPYETWVHVDPATGAVLGRTDRTRRIGRWLFAMLHSWDWLPLLERRPLWDLLLVLLSAGGAALSLTGVVIGWRRLGRKTSQWAARH